MSNVNEMSLLSILQREDEAMKEMRWAGEWLVNYRAKQIGEKEEGMKRVYEEICQEEIKRRDEWLQKLNEARADMKAYFEYHGIIGVK